MYYTIVLIIAIVLLISSLSVVGVMITSGSNKKAFPEFQNSCPDFWKLTSKNGSTVCIPPTNNINTPTVDKFAGNSPLIAHAGVTVDENKIISIDISSSNWTSVCDQSKWALMNGIVWDGVSNTNEC
jgi:hypothetical protein